jgi:hypothetical protein
MVGTAGAHCRVRQVCSIRVIAPEEQPVWGLVELTVQGDLGDHNDVRMMVTVERGNPAQDVCSYNAI